MHTQLNNLVVSSSRSDVNKFPTEEIQNLNQPLITIIAATYNAEKHLPTLINSIREQTYSKVELIVIDGASHDKTLDILRANEDVVSYWLSEPDAGIYDAWNKGVRHTHGEWILFLGADDFLWNSHTLLQMADILSKTSKEVLVTYGRVMLVNEAGESVYLVGESWLNIKNRFKQVMCLPHQGVLHRRSLFEQRGVFDDSFRIAGDYELLLRELRDNDAVFVEGLVVAGMRQGGVSSAPKNSLRALKEIRKAQILHGLRYPGRIWIGAYIRSHIKAWLWTILGEEDVKKILDFYRQMLRLPPYWTKL